MSGSPSDQPAYASSNRSMSSYSENSQQQQADPFDTAYGNPAYNNYNNEQQTVSPGSSTAEAASASATSQPQPSRLPTDRTSSSMSSSKPAPQSNSNTGMIMAPRSGDEETEDGRIRNREAVTKIRDAWIYKQVQARQDEFMQYKQGRLFLGTWNVNAKGRDESLDDWICKDWGPNGEHAPDIVAVGFQEMVDLNAVNVAVDNKSQQRSQYWVDKIQHTINNRKYTNNDPMRAYIYQMHKHLVGLLICVFVKGQHKHRVKYVLTDSVGVGVMGMMGNKGGVCIRLQFYDSTICLVCAHLAAHRENVAGRNSDFANVFNKAEFEIGDEAIKEVIRSGSLSQWATGSSSVGIADHDLVFWMGDLNYRVDESIPTERVLDLSDANNLEELITNDQLNLERAAGRVFQGFEEGMLTFKPTYKYQPGTDMYDRRPDKKIRAPAWCDRVLWMAQDPTHVLQLSYSRSELNISDHKPVMSTFIITIKDVIQEKREQVYDEVMKLLDKYENQTLPMVGLDRLTLDFGEVRYDQTVTLPIKITNTGKVGALFRLANKPDDPNKICKPWMDISPKYGMLLPGEEEAIMHFSITIDNATARALNTGKEILEDILILRLENGRDYYITVTATYARSCFGMSVDELVMYSEPIRNIPLDPIKRAAKQEANPHAALCVPKELWRVIDAIYAKGLQEKDLFTTPGFPEEVYEIREALDTGDPFPSFHSHSMCEVMLSFLSNLSSPIVPTSLFPTMETPTAQNIQSFSRKFLEDLPPIHYNVFVYVISFFRECLLYKDSNKLSANKLSRICCNCFVLGGNLTSGGGEEEESASRHRKAAMQLIMMHFLETNSI